MTCIPVRCTPADVRCTFTRYIWELHVWEMYICKVQLACECVYGNFDFFSGAECRKPDVTVPLLLANELLLGA